MKRFGFSLGLFATLLCASLSAQTMDLRANIPFPFRVGVTNLPAGEYRIHTGNGVLMVKDERGSHSAFSLLSFRAVRRASAAQGLVEFNRYGENYFLAEIWAPGSDEGRGLPTTPQEKELARQFGPVEHTHIALATK
jgi:hypothetical protein